MSRVALIVGLPGSGKTYLAQEYVARGYVLFDDPKTGDHNHRDAILAAVRLGQDVVVCDPHLCVQTVQQAAGTLLRVLGADIEWVYFENDPVTCARNIRYRNDGRVVSDSLRMLSRHYHIPAGVVPRAVWQSPTDEVTDAAG